MDMLMRISAAILPYVAFLVCLSAVLIIGLLGVLFWAVFSRPPAGGEITDGLGGPWGGME